MKRLSKFWVELLLCGCLFGSSASVLGQAQPVNIPRLEQALRVNSISKLRVAEQSDDGMELTLVMEYSYNGNSGSTAVLVPIVDREDQPGVGGWFGADMATVPRGSGPVSMKVRFFSDEPGAPASIETDRVRVLMLNESGSSIIGGKNLIRTIRWGHPQVPPAEISSEQEELIRLAARAEERAREDAKRAAAAEADALKRAEATQNELQKTQAQSLAKQSAEKRVEAEARATEAALIKKEQKELLLAAEEISGKAAPAEQESRITNVEVVNRSRDRSRVTLGIEFELREGLGFQPLIGVRFVSQDVKDTTRMFAITPAKVERRKQFVMLPVTFAPEAGETGVRLLTDQIVVYATDERGMEEIPLGSVTIPLAWRPPGSVGDGEFSGSLALKEFRQRNSRSGYATVKYHLPSGRGQLRVKVFDSRNPDSASWFQSQPVSIEEGRGLELVSVRISPSGGFPGGHVSVDTVEVELLGERGEVLTKVTRLTSIDWSVDTVAAAK